MNFNKVILIGNLTRDPEISYLPSNTPVADFGMAINRRWKGQDGQPREEVCFIDVKAFSKQAETISQYIGKGKPILIEGRLQLDTWEGKDGTKRSKHRVVVERFQFLDSAAGQGKTTDSGTAREGTRGEGGTSREYTDPAPVADEGSTEDIPF